MKSMLPIVMVVTLLSACQRESAPAATDAAPQTTATSTPVAEAQTPAPAVDDTAAPAGNARPGAWSGCTRRASGRPSPCFR